MKSYSGNTLANPAPPNSPNELKLRCGQGRGQARSSEKAPPPLAVTCSALLGQPRLRKNALRFLSGSQMRLSQIFDPQRTTSRTFVEEDRSRRLLRNLLKRECTSSQRCLVALGTTFGLIRGYAHGPNDRPPLLCTVSGGSGSSDEEPTCVRLACWQRGRPT